MAGEWEISEEFMQLLNDEKAQQARAALRGRYLANLEAKLGKPLGEWFTILRVHDPRRHKKQHELTRHLEQYYKLENWVANMVVYYYLNPEKRFELGDKPSA